MIVHILKKDLKLVWPAVVAVLVLRFAAAWAFMQMGIFNAQPNLRAFQGLIDFGASLATGFAIVWALQSEPIVSDNADWLTRPVSRFRLALAKTLFALAVTFVPVFAVNFLVGLWQGLPFAEGLARSTSPTITAFFSVGLPAMALGAITTSRIQAVGVVGAMLVVLVVAIQANIEITHSLMLVRGLSAIAFVQMTTVVGASIAVIGLQYWRRHTSLSRGIFSGAAAILLATVFVPWDMALRLQNVIDGKATDVPIKVGFNDQARMAGSTADLLEMPILYVPLTLTKTEGSIASTDHLQLKLQSMDGHVLYKYPAGIAENRSHSSLSALARGPSPQSSTATYAGVAMTDYGKFKGQTVRASLTYYFTAYQASAPIQAVVPPMQRLTINHVGVCEARQNTQNPTYTDLYCFAAADQPPCLGGSVRYLNTGVVAPLKVRCVNEAGIWDLGPKGILTPGRLAAAYPTPTGNSAVRITLTPYRMSSHYTQTVAVTPTRLENLTPPDPGGQ
jgi:hypothetical protein